MQRLLENTFRLDIYAAREYVFLEQNQISHSLVVERSTHSQVYLRKLLLLISRLVFSHDIQIQ